MSKPPIKSHWFNVLLHPYNIDLVCSVNQSNDEFSDLVKFMVPTLENDEVDYLSDKSNNGYVLDFEGKGIIMRLNDFEHTNFSLAVVAHESFHVAEMVFDRIGSTVNEATSEPFAYLLQYVTQKVFDGISECNHLLNENVENGIQ